MSRLPIFFLFFSFNSLNFLVITLKFFFYTRKNQTRKNPCFIPWRLQERKEEDAWSLSQRREISRFYDSGASGRREAKITKMVALMITAFLLAWSPYAALAIAAQYFNVSIYQDLRSINIQTIEKKNTNIIYVNTVYSRTMPQQV